jgi:hypothetical protein
MNRGTPSPRLGLPPSLLSLSHTHTRPGMFLTRHPKLLFSNSYQQEPFREQQPLWTTKVPPLLSSPHRSQTKGHQGWVDHIWTNADVKVRRVLAPLVRALDPRAEQIDEKLPCLPTKVGIAHSVTHSAFPLIILWHRPSPLITSLWVVYSPSPPPTTTCWRPTATAAPPRDSSAPWL